MSVRVYPGVAAHLDLEAAYLEENVLEGYALGPGHFAPWTRIPELGAFEILGGSVLRNGQPMKPHTDPWTDADERLATILVVYREGSYTGNELVWIENLDGDLGEEVAELEHDLRHGDVAVIPSGVLHWNRPREGWETHYSRLVVAMLAKGQP